MRPAPRTAIPSIFISLSSFCCRRRPKAPGARSDKDRKRGLGGFAIREANPLELPHRRLESTSGSHFKWKFALFGGNHLDAPVAPVTDIQDGLDKGRNVERAFAAQFAVMGRVVEE